MKKILTTILALLLLVSIPMMFKPANAAAKSDLDIIFYEDDGAAFTGLVACEIDFIQWSLTSEQLIAAQANPNLQVGQYVEYGLFEFDVNNNFTIIDYPDKTNPVSIEKVRHAIEFLIDKDYIVASILEYFGSRIDVMIPYPGIPGWANASVITYDYNGNGIIEPSEDNYPFNYNPDAAAALLASCSFGDTDANGYLNYPDDPGVWGAAAGIDTTLMPLKICIRADHAHRTEAGRYLYRQLEGDPAVPGDSILALSPAWALEGKVGGDFDTTDETWVQPRAVLSPIVMGDRNYHIYTGGWSFGRFPTSMFFLFHSMFWYSYGPNYVKAPGTHDDLDVYLEDLYYTVDVPSAQVALQKYTGEHVLRCINIPLWSYTSYVAWKKTVAGVINMKGYGIVNDWTFYNAYRTDVPGAPIRMGVCNSWDRLNILYSQWYFEYALLERVYNGFIGANPYDLSQDIPFAAQDWEAGTWIDDRDGYEKSVITIYLRKDVGFAEPITGNAAGTFMYDDYEFTAWYNYAFDDSWQWSNFMDIHHLEKVDDYTIKIYYDDVSYWFTYTAGWPLLGPKEELIDLLCEEACASFTGADLVEDPPGYYEYQFTADQVVQVINATKNGSPMVEGVDFIIRAGYDTFCHNVFVPLVPIAGGDAITICYYRPIADGANGLFLGGNLGLDWTDTMYATHTHYPIDIQSGTASLNKNPVFIWETPLLGEIDWRWNWVAGPKPRNGYFKIDILDVVKCTGSYSSRGDGVFDPTYFAGADIDGSDLCHVGILDLVTITGKYAQTFNQPPVSYHDHRTPPNNYDLPDYDHGFTEKEKDADVTYTWAAPTVTITAGADGHRLKVWYYTALNALEEAVITIDP